MPNGKNFTVLQMPENYTIEVGRSETEVNIPDMSVDKSHGFLKYDSDLDEVVYSDNDSKYGSQVMIQKLVPLKLNESIFLVNGMSMIQVTLMKQKQSYFEMLKSCFNP